MNRFLFVFFIGVIINANAQKNEKLILNAKAEIDFKNYSEALVYIDSISEKDYYAFYLSGQSYFELEDYSKAISNFKSCNQLKANYADYYLAKSYALSQDFKSAKTYLDEYLNLVNKRFLVEVTDEPSFSNFKETDIWASINIEETYSIDEKSIARANFYKRKGEIGLALDILDELLEENKNSAEAYFYRAEFIIDLNEDYKYAIADLKKAIKLNPESYKYQKRLAEYYYHELKYSKAVKHFKIVQSIFPYQLENYFKISQSYFRLGEIVEAKKYIDLFLEIDFRNIDALKLAGQLYYENEDYKESIYYFSEAIYINSRRIDLLVLRGNAYMESEDFQRAEMDYNIAANIEPRNGQYWFLKAQALLALGRKDDACKNFKKARYLNYYQADVYLLEECN